MSIVRENLYGLLNENMQQARAILAKMRIPEEDPRFQQLKQMLVKDNRIGYVGKFTKWLFQDREPWEKLIEVYQMLQTHTAKVPPIDTFKTIEDLFDFLQGSGIETKVNQVVNSIPSRARQHANKELRKLIELNIKYAPALKDFYSKKGGKFKDARSLYAETDALIKNLSGGFNIDAIKKKIKDKKCAVEVILERPDLLVIKPLDYSASNVLGSSSWCISYSKNYWDSYADVFSNQYFIYDFTKSLSDKKSMIGVTVNPDGSFKASHFKDDSVAPRDYIDDLLSD